MKKLTRIFLPVLAITFGITSCDKTTTPAVPTTTTPTTTTPTTPTPVMPTVNNSHWGVMVALKTKLAYTAPQVGTPITVETDMAIATFYDGIGSSTIVDAGAVTINSNTLEKQTNNSYLVTATPGMTPSSLSLGNNVKWSVAGGSSTPAIDYSHNGPFPDYTGTLPTEIDKSVDLEISLGSKISGADSVYVVIISADKQIIKSYNGNPAPSKITIDASELSGLNTVSDNTAYLEIVPFTYVVRATSGKDFVYIKETAALSAINIK